MRIETKQRNGHNRLIILFVLLLAASGLSLNGNGNRNPVIPASDRSTRTAQSKTEKHDSPADRSAFCKEDKAHMQIGLGAIFHDFQRSDSATAIESLVSTDSRIRALLDRRPSYRPCEDDSGIYDPQWEAIGVNLGYWLDLVYSGRLLNEAHMRNPNSQLRRYTMFSTIFGTEPYHGLGVMPDIKAALRYASEFPDGPFAKETFRAIADFHKDLFMVFRDNKRDHKHDCYKPYITTRSIHTQQERARRTALAYYRKALEIDPSNEELKALSNDVENGAVKTWSFCSD